MELNSKTRLGITGVLLAGVFLGDGCHKAESEVDLGTAGISRSRNRDILTQQTILATAREIGSVDWPLVELRTSNPDVAAAWGKPYTSQQDIHGSKSYRVWVLVSPEEYGNVRVGNGLQSQLAGDKIDLGNVTVNNKTIHSEYYYVTGSGRQEPISAELGREVLANASSNNFIQVNRFMSRVFVAPSVINPLTIDSVRPHTNYFLTINLPDTSSSASTPEQAPAPTLNLGGVLSAVRYPSYFKMQVPAEMFDRLGGNFDSNEVSSEYSLSGRLHKIAGKIIKHERVPDTNSLDVTLTDGSHYIGSYGQIRRLQAQP